MKQIKVTDTRMHKARTGRRLDNNLPAFKDAEEIPVAEAKLVLIWKDCKMEDKIDHLLAHPIENKYAKPILISKTEKIEVGDWIYNFQTNKIWQTKVNYSGVEGIYKILALPEHFSPAHLQAIVDGKMKDGDKVAVECEQLRSEEVNSPIGKINIVIAKSPHNNESNSDMSVYKYFIKLNSSNHITLHKVEETTYSFREMIEFVKWYSSMDQGKVVNAWNRYVLEIRKKP